MEEPENNVIVRLKDAEMFKIKLCLSSLTNTVVICPVLCSIYVKNDMDDVINDDVTSDSWTFMKRGAPCMVLIHDLNRDVCASQICVADPDSGFAVWRESVDKKCDYKLSEKNFHTFRLKDSEKGNMAGIIFPSIEYSNIFLKDVLSNLPDETVVACREGSPKSIERRRSTKKLKKNEISSPCMFTHVSSISNKKLQKKETKKKVRGSEIQGSGSSLDNPNADPT